MKNKFIILCLLSVITFLNASNTIKISYDEVKIDEFVISYYLDKNSSLSIDKINNLKFKTISNHHSFGNIDSPVWIKLKLENTTEIQQEIFLHNNYAYLSKEITIYEFLDDKLVDKNIYNILEKESNKLTGSVLVYPIVLKANSSKTIYMKNIAVVTQASNLKIYDKKNSFLAFINKDILSIIIVIVLLSLAFYNIFLYLFNRKKEFIYYSVFLINASIGLSYMYGLIFHNLQVYGEEIYWLNITALLVSAFLVLFIKSIFNFKQNNKRLDTLLNYIIYMVIIDILIAIFIDLQLSIDLIALVYLYSFGVIFYISFKLIKQNHPLTKIFISTCSIYVIGFTLTILSFYGLIPINTFTFHASGISLVIESLLFSYLIHYNFKILKDKLIKQQNTLIVKNQKEKMGDMIGAITHQWKQPLNAISSSAMLVQYKLEEKKVDMEDIKNKMQQIEERVEFLSHTIDDFRNFFSSNKIKKSCDIEKLINKAVSFSKDDSLSKNIKIIQDLNFTSNITIFENEFLHILLNLIQNSKEAFRDSKRESSDVKMIKIIGTTRDDKIYIDIMDNAGGVSKENLPHIFDENYTTKAKENGSGLGLHLCKIIIQEHMNGSINVKNIGSGAMFRIIL